VLSGVDVVTARALASLDNLLTLVSPYVSVTTTCIFMKGRDAQREIDEARRRWCFDILEHASITDQAAKILVVNRLAAISNAAGEVGRVE
jgi:16S rRNA (guanine527-N7)-methyltransferase